ncbi:MAG: hypothetical protein ACKOZV_10390, partial [Bacteroidota bacterium]
MHTLINTLHSYNRYLILAALVYVLYRSWTGWKGNRAFEKGDNTASVALLGLAHLQLVLGLVQYFGFSAYVNFSDMAATMKNPITRYFSVEHITIMILAIAAVQVGRTLSKKAADDTEKHKKLAIWTTIAAVLVVVGLSMKGLLFGTVAGM